NKLRCKPRLLNSICRAGHRPADTIDANDILMDRKRLTHAIAGDLGVIVAGDQLDALQVGAFGSQHAAKAALAFLMRTIELPAPHDRELAVAAAEAPHEKSGRA